LPNAKLEVINKAGHYVHMDKPQELVQVMAKFLDEVPDEVARLASN
jgi:pimeloyl-ACP methyl ester carboxylesterase